MSENRQEIFILPNLKWSWPYPWRNPRKPTLDEIKCHKEKKIPQSVWWRLCVGMLLHFQRFSLSSSFSPLLCCVQTCRPVLWSFFHQELGSDSLFLEYDLGFGWKGWGRDGTEWFPTAAPRGHSSLSPFLSLSLCVSLSRPLSQNAYSWRLATIHWGSPGQCGVEEGNSNNNVNSYMICPDNKT